MTLQKIMSYTRRALEDYNMISEGDRICVGISGGKDSLALLSSLVGLKRFYPEHFELEAVTIDNGIEGSDYSSIESFCKDLGVNYTVIKTNIAEVVFDIRREKNPCSLCANMRRGALSDTAVKLGCNKIALGHHNDDVIDTFMMNLLNVGHIGTFSPVTELDRSGVTLIRPLILAPENEISSFAKKENLPVVKSPCPMDKKTGREDIKNLIFELSRTNRDIKAKLFGAICRSHISGFTDKVHERRK